MIHISNSIVVSLTNISYTNTRGELQFLTCLTADAPNISMKMLQIQMKKKSRY